MKSMSTFRFKIVFIDCVKYNTCALPFSSNYFQRYISDEECNLYNVFISTCNKFENNS